MTADDPVGPALDDDSRLAYLFETVDGAYLGVTLRKDGSLLPRGEGQVWHFQTEFRLGVHEPVPAAIDPEPILRGLKADGFFIWPVKRTLPMGTGQ